MWVEIPGGMRQDDEYTAFPRLAVDGRGRVHAVWTVMPFPGRFVTYARSDDGGDTCNEPQVIDSADRVDYADGYGPIFIDVETHGEDGVHLIWDGAPTVERNHVWSCDGGNTWSAPSLLIPEITGAGRSGWNDMVVDSASTLHAVALKQPWHASWSGGMWSRSTDIGTEKTRCAEWMRIALSLGNRLHVVWVERCTQPNPVWYVQGQTSAPAVAAQAVPTVSSAPIPTSTPAATPTAVESPVTETAQPRSDNSTLFGASSNPMDAVVVGLIPALFVIGIVFVVSILPTRWR